MTGRGDPANGLEQPQGGTVVIGETHEVVWVSGSDAVSFLDGLLSQTVAGIAAGTVQRSLLLSPRGKLRAPLWLLHDEEQIGIVAESGFRKRVVADLTRFRIRVHVDFAEDDRSPLTVWGPAAFAVAEEATGIAAGPGRWVDRGGVLVGALPLVHDRVARVLVAGLSVVDLSAAGAESGTSQTAQATRIEEGEPAMGVDIDDDTIPQEAALVAGAVDFGKGCYLGQELVARIDARGHVNRHLRGVAAASDAVAPVGSTVVSEGREVGHLTSVSPAATHGGMVGLAMLRREVEPGSEVELVSGGERSPARVVSLPFPRPAD